MPAGRFLIQRRDREIDDISIESDGLIIGRLPGSELVLNHRAVDETHSGIKEIDGRYWIFNLSSGNGIVINQTLVERAEIADGDVLQVGPYLVRFALGAHDLTLIVEVGAGWQVAETGPQASPDAPHATPEDILDAPALAVFWEKRKRESGKVADETILHPRGERRLGKALTCWRPTLDLRRPWRPAYFVWGAIIVALFGLTALAAWRPAYSPGELASPHQTANLPGHNLAKRAVNGSCSACHSAVRSSETRCLECHQVAGFGEAISDAHQKAGMGCSSCHREHKGSDPRAGLTNAAVCADCHTDKNSIHEGRRAGVILGMPHPTTHGYPVVDGVWIWKGLDAGEWKVKGLPEYLEQRPAPEQFHAVHRAVQIASATKNRLECGTCHGAGIPRKEERPLALAQSCERCHGTIREKAAGEKAAGEKAASSVEQGAGCISCHPPHGLSREAKSVIAALRGDFRLLGQQVEAQRSRASQTTAAMPQRRLGRLGALPWPAWTGILFLPGVISLVAWSIRSAKLRSSLASLQAGPESTATEAAVADGPRYPHPVIDPHLCIGCHACVNACPHDVLAIVNGVATPIALDQCMEDISCMMECPTSPKACIVVNTTKKVPPRKVPRRDDKYMTDVPGIYVAGDVSGVPLIKNALNEGTLVIQHVVDDLEQTAPDELAMDVEYDVGILGIGPAGFSATMCAHERGLKYVAIEQSRLAHTLRSFPAGKYVFFRPDTAAVKGSVPLPGAGGMKEELLRTWDQLAAGVEIHESERCTGIRQIPGGFAITTQSEAGQGQHTYPVRKVVLAIGNAGSPMKLGAPGEDLKVQQSPDGKLVPKVKYKLSDPADYVGRKCIVVGAGNSAIEAAVALTGFERKGDQFAFTRTNEVALVVRSDFKGDLNLGNKMNIYDCMDAGRIKVYFRTTIKEIGEREVVLADAKDGAEKARLENDVIFALIGTERPTKFLQSLGIQIEGDKRPADEVLKKAHGA